MRRGGRYKVKSGGEPERVAGTEPHPEGNRARASDGTPLDEQGKPVAQAKSAKSGKASGSAEASSNARTTKSGGE